MSRKQVVGFEVSGLDAALDHIRSLQHPSPATIARLNEIGDAMFETTQRAVHRDSGALKATGNLDTDFDHATSAWSAEIGYGNTRDTGWAAIAFGTKHT